MKEQVNTIDRLDRRLAQINEFIERDVALLREDPQDFAVELSLGSLERERQSLEDELKLERRGFNHRAVIISLKKNSGAHLSKDEMDWASQELIEGLIRAISLAYFFRATGRGPNKGLSEKLDSVSPFAYTTREEDDGTIYLLEKTKAKPNPDNPFETAILGILKTLNSHTYHSLFESFLAVGLDCAIQMKTTLAEIDRRGIIPRLAWISEGYSAFWRGDDRHSAKAFERLSLAEHVHTRKLLVTGSIVGGGEGFIIMQLSEKHEPVKVFYSDLQRLIIQNKNSREIFSIDASEQKLNLGERESITAIRAVT